MCIRDRLRTERKFRTELTFSLTQPRLLLLPLRTDRKFRTELTLLLSLTQPRPFRAERLIVLLLLLVLRTEFSVRPLSQPRPLIIFSILISNLIKCGKTTNKLTQPQPYFVYISESMDTQIQRKQSHKMSPYVSNKAPP